MNENAPLWLDVIVATIVGGAAGGLIAYLTDRDVTSRAAATGTAFGLMTVAWRSSSAVERKVQERNGTLPRGDERA